MMTHNFRNIVTHIFFIVIIGVFVIGCNYVNRQKGRRNNFEKQLGTYKIDLLRTKLGSYAKDSLLYKNLEITFRKDSTFYMNMQVPFFADSIGEWVAGNMLEWNWMFFRNLGRDRSKTMPNPDGTQFTRIHIDSLGEFFLISSPTPVGDNQVISKIFFRKIVKEK